MLNNEAAQYFVKLHIIAGQMSTEQMNNTDTFYTLTGKSGEIFSGDKVRVSLIFTPRMKLLTESMAIASSLLVSGGHERFRRTPFLVPYLSEHFPTQEKNGEQHRKGSSRRRGGLLQKGNCKVISLWSELVFKTTIIQLPAGRRNLQ